MSILNIRKNYPNPVDINFKKSKLTKEEDLLSQRLNIRVFRYFSNNIYEEEKHEIVEFPIKIIRKTKEKNTGLRSAIKDHLDEIITRIHGSFENKDKIIMELNDKYPDVSKKALNNFFKEKYLKQDTPK